ncbi:MAG: hypothetical protein ABW042_09175 [Phenylobacterium sp.]
MAGRNDYYGRNSEYDAYERNRRDLEGRGGRDERSQDRPYGGAGDDQPYRTGEAHRWQGGRADSRYDQDRAGYVNQDNRPEWQRRDWQGGSPGLRRYDYDDSGRVFRQVRGDRDGYGGQEYGIESSRSAGDFGRSPEPVQRVTDGEDEGWRQHFGDDGRPHPRFRDDDRHERRFERDDDARRRERHDHEHERRSFFGHRDEDEERRRHHEEDRARANYAQSGSLDPFEADASWRRQEEHRRRGEEERRRRADIEQREQDWRRSQDRGGWDW